MKKTFSAKLPFPTILATISTAFLALFIIVVYINKLSADFSMGSLFGLLLFILILGYAIAQVLFFLSFYFKSAVVDDGSISIFELYKLKTTAVPFEEIEGYSKSEVYFGKYGFKSPSLVVYFKSGKVAELLNDFVADLDLLEKELQEKGITYLGSEPYSTGVFIRNYQYGKK